MPHLDCPREGVLPELEEGGKAGFDYWRSERHHGSNYQPTRL